MCVFYFGQFHIELVDDLNFQVGMAHFSEEQHECILNSLGAMFCYRNKKVHTCIIYVVNTPCRPNEESKKTRCHLLMRKGSHFLFKCSLLRLSRILYYCSFLGKNLPNILFLALFIALQYLDYVMKVMLPEALIKLYQDIHKTSFEKVS